MLSLEDFIIDNDSLSHKDKEFRIEVSQEEWDVYLNDEYCKNFSSLEEAVSYVLFSFDKLEK